MAIRQSIVRSLEETWWHKSNGLHIIRPLLWGTGDLKRLCQLKSWSKKTAVSQYREHWIYLRTHKPILLELKLYLLNLYEISLKYLLTCLAIKLGYKQGLYAVWRWERTSHSVKQVLRVLIMQCTFYQMTLRHLIHGGKNTMYVKKTNCTD